MRLLCCCLASLLVVAITGAGAQTANLTGVRSHPCVLVNAETLTALRAKAADQSPNRFGFATADLWKTLQQKADRFVVAEPYSYSVKIPGVGGVVLEEWSYTLSDQTPPPHDKSPNYPPWTAMFQERADSITTRLVHLSFAYLVTGEERYFQKAREMALHLTKWEQWTDTSYSAGRLKACLDTGHCTYAMALFYDWCQDRLTEAERREVREAIVTKGIEACLADVDRYPPDTNGYAVVLSGAALGALAVRPEVGEAAGHWLATCIDKLRVSLDRGGKDGGTFEGPMYGTYLLDSLDLIIDGLTSAKVEHDLFSHPYLATMERYCLGLLAPDTLQIPCFSDGSPGVAMPRTMHILAQRGSQEAAYYLQLIGALQPEAVYDFARFDASKLNPTPPTWNPSTVFVDIGYASLRDGFNAQAPSLFFKSGPYRNNIGHNHYDHNAFVISYGKQWLIPDRGYHSFYIPPWTKFSLGSIGHCTVVLNTDEAYFERTKVPDPGYDQVKRFGGRIVEFFAGEAFDYVKGEAAEAYNTDQLKVLDRFDRSIVYLKPHYFIIRDDLQAPQPQAYNFLLHSDGVGSIEAAGEAFTVTRTNAQVYARLLSSAPAQAHIGAYPKAEKYGPFLRLETEKTPAVNFTAVLYPRPYQSANFVRNGGFESGLSGWQPRANEDLPNHQVVTDNPAEGKHCARIEQSGYYYSERFGVPVGTQLTARLKIRTTELPADKGATATWYFWKGDKAFQNRRIGPFASADWTEHEHSVVVPPDTEQVSLALEFFAPGTAWFDDVRITSDQKVEPPLTPEITPLGNQGLRVVLAGQTTHVLFGQSGKPTTAGELTSDAELALVTYEGGQPVRAFLKGGTFVTARGQKVLQLEQPGSAEVRREGQVLKAQATDSVVPHAPLKLPGSVTVGWPVTEATLNGRPAKITRGEAGCILRP